MGRYNPLKLEKSHPLYFLEEVVEKSLGLATPAHDAEHITMMRHWGIKYANVAPLDGDLVVDLEADNINKPKYSYKPRREYHLTLHVKFWDEINNNIDVVARYNALADQGVVPQLADIPLPNIHPEDPKGSL